MKYFTISLSEEIAKASYDTAKTLGLSRTEFVRQAILHELDNVKTDLAQKEIILCFNNMKSSEKYITESREILDELNTELP